MKDIENQYDEGRLSFICGDNYDSTKHPDWCRGWLAQEATFYDEELRDDTNHDFYYIHGKEAFKLGRSFNSSATKDWQSGWLDAEAEAMLDEELRITYYG